MFEEFACILHSFKNAKKIDISVTHIVTYIYTFFITYLTKKETFCCGCKTGKGMLYRTTFQNFLSKFSTVCRIRHKHRVYRTIF